MQFTPVQTGELTKTIISSWWSNLEHSKHLSVTRGCHSRDLKYTTQLNGKAVGTLIRAGLMDTDTIQLEMDFWASRAAVMVYRGSSAPATVWQPCKQSRRSFSGVDAHFNFLQICLRVPAISKVAESFYPSTEKFMYTLLILFICKN